MHPADRGIELAHAHWRAGKPTLVSPVRMPCWPVRNADAAGRAGLLAVVLQEPEPFLADAVDVRRLVAHQAVAVGADIGDADVIAADDEDVGLRACRRGLGRWCLLRWCGLSRHHPHHAERRGERADQRTRAFQSVSKSNVLRHCFLRLTIAERRCR